MNEVFPDFETTDFFQAPLGSVGWISRSSGVLLCFVAAHHRDEKARSLVILSGPAGKPTPLFADNWSNRQCLLLRAAVRFEIDPVSVGQRLNEHWETSGVLVSVGNHLFLRVVVPQDFRDEFVLVDVETGELFLESTPENPWVFPTWRIWIRDPARAVDISLFSFDALSKQK